MQTLVEQVRSRLQESDTGYIVEIYDYMQEKVLETIPLKVTSIFDAKKEAEKVAQRLWGKGKYTWKAPQRTNRSHREYGFVKIQDEESVPVGDPSLDYRIVTYI